MAGPAFVPPGLTGAQYQAPSEEMVQIAKTCSELWDTIQDLRKHPPDGEHRAALDFFGRIRALSGMVALLAEQPGYRPTDEEGAAVRKRMEPLRTKMAEIVKQLNDNVNMMDPLPYSAPNRVKWMQYRADKLASILLDPAHAKPIEAVGADKTLSWSAKATFFDWVGHFVHEAMMEVLKSKKHEQGIFDAVNRALDSRERNTMIGACLWTSQTAASAAGNLPGPNSLYVGMIRFKALQGLQKLGPSAAKALLGDIVPHWYDALRLSPDERTKFEAAMKRFEAEHNRALTEKNATAAGVARGEAQKAHDEMKRLVRTGGRPQSGVALSATMSVVNLLCLFLAWDALSDDKWNPSKWSKRNWADLAAAALQASTGICNTVIRWRANVGLAQKIIESGPLGAAIGIYVGMVAVIEGVDLMLDEWSRSNRDWWVLISGGLQVGSGVAIVFGAVFGSPGLQLIGVLAGLGATVIALIDDAVQDKMVRYLSELIKQVKEAKSLWDGTLIMNNLGLTSLIEDFEKLIASCGVTELAYNRNWTGRAGLVVSKGILHDKLNDLGITDGLYRDKLIRAVWV